MNECKDCSLCGNSFNPCLAGDGNEKAKVMFIQDFPDEFDDKAGIPFSTPSCKALKKSIENREIPIDNVYFTSLVRCVCEEKEAPTASVSACQHYLEEEIAKVDPDIIIPTGNKSLRFCVGRVGLTKMRGNAQEVDLLGRKRIILPMMSPKMVGTKPMYKEFILKDLDTLKDLYFNGMTQVTGVDYRYLETVEDVTSELVRMKQEAKRIVFDLETTGKSPYFDYSKIVCISLTDKSHYGVVIPLYKSDSPFTLAETGYIVKLLRWLLEDSSIPKSAHNGKFDIEWLRVQFAINVANFDFDTIFGHYVAISEEQGSQGLKSQAWEFTDMGGYDNELDEYVKKLSDGEGEKSRYNYDRVPWDILKTYAAADVDCCYRLVEIYKPLIDENDMWKTLMNDILMPGSYALSEIEENGMKIDMELSDRYQESYEREIKRITDRLYQFPEVLEIEREKQALYSEREELIKISPKDRTPEEKKKISEYAKYKEYKFNFNSVVSLRELLYTRLGLTTSVTTAKGELSTNETAMEELKKQHEIPNLLLELKKVNTLNNMFIKKLPTLKDGNGIVHSSFNMTGCITGDSLILTSEGIKPIESFLEEKANGKFFEREVKIVNKHGNLESTSHIVYYKNQSTIKLTTRLGFEIEGTHNHPIIVNYFNKNQVFFNHSTKLKAKLSENRCFKQLSEIDYDDLICIPYCQNIYGNKVFEISKFKLNLNTNCKDVFIPDRLTPELAELLGMYYADGWVKSSNGSWHITICNQDKDVIERVKFLSEELFGVEANNYSDKSTSYTSIGGINLAPLEEILELKRGCLNKRIPQFILDAPKEIQISYLRGMTLDGHYNKNRHRFNLSLANEGVAKTVQIMLLNMGIISYRKNIFEENSFKVIVSNEEYCKFRDLIGFVQSKKCDLEYNGESGARNYFIDKENNCMWLRVKSIEYKNSDVYDFVVPETHSFISNGFISHNTVTGRLSSENPNFQQIPRKAGDNPLLFQYHNEPKSLFISRFGKDGCILNADFSALEMRLAAVISGDKKMTQAFLSGVDIHKANASYMYNVPVEEVTKDLRTNAKSLGFGIIYGKSGVTFAKDLFYDPSGKDPKKTSDWEQARKQGFDIVDHFLNTFSGLKKWLEKTKKFAYKHGYVETMFGRRRRLPDLNSKVRTLRSDAERQAINAPIQGTGSDLTMLSVIKINEFIKENHMKSLLVATVHDSIVFDIYLPELHILAEKIKYIMEHVHEPYIDTDVPIIAELELGLDYGSTAEVSVEECKSILTREDLDNWIYRQNFLKYEHEILTLKKMGKGYKEVIEYLVKYDRPLKELADYLVEVYSEKK